MKKFFRVFVSSLLIALVGVFVIDYFSHLLFSSPMETTGYFWGKASVYFVFSFIFLYVIHLEKREFWKVLAGGIIVASLWGMYYNVFPLFIDYYPTGISLNGLSFLGMGILGTGLAFGTVHTFAFIGGYFTARVLGLLKVN